MAEDSHSSAAPPPRFEDALAAEYRRAHRQALNAANVDSIYPDGHPELHDGWQAPTAVTGYAPPLSVRVQRDANGAVVVAMAQVEYDYWTIDNSDPEAGLGMTLTGATLAGLSLWANAARLRSRDRRRHS